jgi:hypothetical protein
MPLTDDQVTLFMGAVAIAPSNPSTIYAGTGEADNSFDWLCRKPPLSPPNPLSYYW